VIVDEADRLARIVEDVRAEFDRVRATS